MVTISILCKSNSHHLPQPQTSVLTLTQPPNTQFQGRLSNDELTVTFAFMHDPKL